MRKAIVMKTKKKYVLVLDDESRYLRLKHKDGIKKGQQIYFIEKDLYGKPKVNLRTALAAVAVVALVGFMLTIQLPAATAIPLMTVSIDVNPSVEMDIGEDFKVTEVRAMNEDAKALVRSEWKGEEYGSVLSEYFQTLSDEGYLEENNEVLFGYAWLDQEREPDREMQGTLQQQGQNTVDGICRDMNQELNCLHIQTNEQERIQARENQESIGRYTVMNRLQIQVEEDEETPNIEALNRAYRNFSLDQEKEDERKNQMQENVGTDATVGSDDASASEGTEGNDDTGNDQQGNKSTDSGDGQKGSSDGSGGK